jgi:hypothetical protein
MNQSMTDLKSQFQSILVGGNGSSAAGSTASVPETDLPTASNGLSPRIRMIIVFVSIALLLLCGYMMTRAEDVTHSKASGELDVTASIDDITLRKDRRFEAPIRIDTDPLFQPFLNKIDNQF